jgi:hypothetical protein
MSETTSPDRYDDETLWDDAITLETEETKDAKVHVTLRIDPVLYKALLKFKQDSGARTITQAVESVLRIGLFPRNDRNKLAEAVVAMARTLAQHTLLQDQLIHRLCNASQRHDAFREESGELWKDSQQVQNSLRRCATLVSVDEIDISGSASAVDLPRQHGLKDVG